MIASNKLVFAMVGPSAGITGSIGPWEVFWSIEPVNTKVDISLGKCR